MPQITLADVEFRMKMEGAWTSEIMISYCNIT
jgi:hypothetical protein